MTDAHRRSVIAGDASFVIACPAWPCWPRW